MRRLGDNTSRVMKEGKTSENRSNSEARNPAVLAPNWVFQHPARFLEHFLTVAEYRTLETGQSLQSCELFADRLLQRHEQFLSILPVVQAAQLAVAWLTRATPEDLRGWFLMFVRSLDAATLLEAARAVESLFEFRESCGEALNSDWEIVRDTSPEQLATDLQTRAIAALEALPLQSYDEIRVTALKALSELISDPYSVLQTHSDCIQGGLWHMQKRLIAEENAAHRSWLGPPENGAFIEYAEYQNAWRDDGGHPLRVLWNLGVRAEGRKIDWEAAVSSIATDENTVNAVYHVFEVVTDRIDKKPLSEILDQGTRGQLIYSLKAATWNDRNDGLRRDRAQKRRGETLVADMRDSFPEKSDEEILSQIASMPSVDTIADELELKSVVDELLHEPSLTERERELVVREYEISKQGNPTLEELAKIMGISRPRACQLRNSAHQKLRTKHPVR